MILKSRRQFKSPDEFVEAFLKTITPGIIPIKEFIHWDSIEQEISRLLPYLDFYQDLRPYIPNREQFIEKMSTGLLSSSDPFDIISCGFELLGHTDEKFSGGDVDVDVYQISREIARGSKAESRKISTLMYTLGIGRAIACEDMRGLLRGIQLGLETHKRKNRGGGCFDFMVKSLLGSVVDEINREIRHPVSLVEKKKLRFGKDLSKEVDFSIDIGKETIFGIEANFYTSSGSKPTEIKRSYGNIQGELEKGNIVLVWITDGKGYRQMWKSLANAYEIMPNIYNFNQAREYLSSDIIDYLKTSRSKKN